MADYLSWVINRSAFVNCIIFNFYCNQISNELLQTTTTLTKNYLVKQFLTLHLHIKSKKNSVYCIFHLILTSQSSLSTSGPYFTFEPVKRLL